MSVIEVATQLTGEALLRVGSYEPAAMGKSPSAEFARELNANVFGQSDASQIIARAVVSARAGYADPRKPRASFMFLGPTGVGKTEMARTMANVLGLPFIRIDCTDLQEGSSITRLKGTEAKFVGYGDPTLIMPDMIKGGAVVAFDEIEKAHLEIWRWLMPVLGEGRTTLFLPNGVKNPNGTDGQQIVPTTLDFTKAYVVMTTNEGAESMQAARQDNRLGFNTQAVQKREGDITKIALAALKSGRFRQIPEFLGRINHKIVFGELLPEHYSRIFHKFLERANDDLLANNPAQAFRIASTTRLRDAVLQRSGISLYGARDIENTLRGMVIAEAAEYKLSGAFGSSRWIVADYVDDTVMFYKHKQGISEQPANSTSHAIPEPPNGNPALLLPQALIATSQNLLR